MAEYLINHDLAGEWFAWSAGVAPGNPKPQALQALREVGIDPVGARSKSVEEFLRREDLDLVITVCDHARESCPVFLRPVEQMHIGVEDPAPYCDGPEEIAMQKFREVRDTLRREVVGYLRTI